MDEIVARSLAKWPNVPAVYGWLSLDRRGNWLIRSAGAAGFEKIGNAALREFIGRNYDADEKGRWFFQNGPQRVFVTLAYTPLVVRSEGDAWIDQRGLAFAVAQTLVDDEGSVLLVSASGTVALVDDRDLAGFADGAEALPVIARAEVPLRFGFEADPRPG
jgi:hypothetical protein